jgi:hypothetical protein
MQQQSQDELMLSYAHKHNGAQKNPPKEPQSDKLELEETLKKRKQQLENTVMGNSWVGENVQDHYYRKKSLEFDIKYLESRLQKR